MHRERQADVVALQYHVEGQVIRWPEEQRCLGRPLGAVPEAAAQDIGRGRQLPAVIRLDLEVVLATLDVRDRDPGNIGLGARSRRANLDLWDVSTPAVAAGPKLAVSFFTLGCLSSTVKEFT